jgi:hypothetical protein
MRLAKAYTVAEAIAAICGPFGLGVRYEDDGTRTVFCWRTRQVPVATITVDDLVAPASPWWKTEEQSKLFSVEWQFKRYDLWPGIDQRKDSTTDRPFDGVMEFDESPIVFQVAAAQKAGTRTESYTVPGTLLSGSGDSLESLLDVCAVWTDQTFGVYANGGITTEIEVFHELLSGPMPRVGEQVTVDLSPRPGFDPYETPVAQRGLPAHCLVIGRTPTTTGFKLNLLEMPQDILPPSDPGVPFTPGGIYNTAFTAVKGAGSFSSNTVVVTLVDNTNWDPSWTIPVQYLVNPPATPTDATAGARWFEDLSPTTSLIMSGFPAGATVWIRLTDYNSGSFTAWQSVTLDAGESSSLGVIVQTPTLQPTVDNSGDVDVTANGGGECVKVYAAASDTAYPSRATILSGSTDTTAPFTFNNIINIDRGETAYIGAIAEDAKGNTSIASYSAIKREPAVEESLSVTFAGGITAGDFRDIQVPFACEVLGWTVLGNATGSIVIDVWRDTVANFPPTVGDSIAGTGKPTITSATNATGNVSLWGSTALVKDDILRFYVDSVSTFTQVTVSLTVRRT